MRTSPPVLCPHYPLGAAGSFSAWHLVGLASARPRPPAHQDISVPYHILRLCHSLARGPPCRHTVPPSRTAGGKPLSPRPSPLGWSQPEAHGPSSPGIPARVICRLGSGQLASRPLSGYGSGDTCPDSPRAGRIKCRALPMVKPFPWRPARRRELPPATASVEPHRAGRRPPESVLPPASGVAGLLGGPEGAAWRQWERSRC